jgi:1-acyl-sn-glycerol-3-phosphate acyltransferase
MIAAFIKITLFIAVLIVYTLISISIDIVIRNKKQKLRLLADVTTIGCKIALRVLGISVKAQNKPADKSALKNVLVVSNHMSYLDILCISSVFPSLYITSVEVQRTFFLGLMARLAGSLFVERRSKSLLLKEIDRIADVLKDGFTITLFPEGTSSNGDKVLPFKSALFSTAEKAGVKVRPICIKYTQINKGPVTPENRDLAFYYGDLEFFPHLLKLFFVKHMSVEITFIEPPDNLPADRKDLVNQMFTAISETYSRA